MYIGTTFPPLPKNTRNPLCNSNSLSDSERGMHIDKTNHRNRRENRRSIFQMKCRPAEFREHTLSETKKQELQIPVTFRHARGRETEVRRETRKSRFIPTYVADVARCQSQRCAEMIIFHDVRDVAGTRLRRGPHYIFTCERVVGDQIHSTSR